MRSSALSRPYRSKPCTTCSFCCTLFLMRLRTDILTGYGYGYGGFTGTGTSAPSATYAPYGNSSTGYYVPSGTASGAPYKTGDPTYYPTHGPYPFPSGTAGDPSAKGTAASTGFASAPSGGYKYIAPRIPSEYFYHHRKPKRNVRRSLTSFPSGGDILMED